MKSEHLEKLEELADRMYVVFKALESTDSTAVNHVKSICSTLEHTYTEVATLLQDVKSTQV